MMLKKLMLAAAVLMGGFSLAQNGGGFPYPVDGFVGQRWIGTNEAGWYGGLRTYVPLGASLFDSEIFVIPEAGINYNTLQPYLTVELNVDLESATLAAFATYMGGVPRINLEARFCILSSRCSE